MQRFKHDRPRFYPDLDGEYVLHSEAQARIETLKNALKPFADKDECDEVGCIVGYDPDHTAQCTECQRILAARAALENSK